MTPNEPMIGVETRNHAIALYNQAVLSVQNDKNLAYRLYCSSVEVDPTLRNGWLQVGLADADMNLLPAAAAAFRRALELEGRDPKTLIDLGHRLYHMGRIREARKMTERALEIDPGNGFGWCNLSLIESIAGNIKKSLSLARRAFEIDKDPIIEMSLAFALLHAGEYADGLKHLESRFPYALPQYLEYPWPQWRGDDLKGKILFIQSEQGMGDSLSFMRFLPPIAERAQQIIFATQPELLPLAQVMLAPWPNITLIPLPCPFPAADFWSTPMCLPRWLGLSDQEIADTPGIPIPETRLPTPWKARGRDYHIGICWTGSAGNKINKWRSVPVEDFLELYRVSGIQLYSLQIGDRSGDLHQAGAAPLIKDLSPYVRDCFDSIGLIRELDLIICVETALGHLAGAIDKECWILYGYHGGDWRIGRSEGGSLWYPKHRIFKQDEGAQWGPVINRVVEALRQRVA